MELNNETGGWSYPVASSTTISIEEFKHIFGVYPEDRDPNKVYECTYKMPEPPKKKEK